MRIACYRPCRVSEIHRVGTRTRGVRRGDHVPRISSAMVCSCALSLAACAQERGRLLGVEAGGDAASSSIDLIGDRPLSFTTLKLREPPRVVVDFADTELSGIARELSVDDGTVV